MRMFKRLALVWAMAVAAAAGVTASAAAQETAAEYQGALTGAHASMNALTLELERFVVNRRYCKPPMIPSKAEAQAELDALAARAQALNQRYATLKVGYTQLAGVSGPGGYMMAEDADPSSVAFWRSYEAARRRMNSALERKRAALATAPELDCRPKPKPRPQTAVTTGGFQPPVVPQRPTPDTPAPATFPPHFCSQEEYWAFVHQQNLAAERAAENAERIAKFRAGVARAINVYVQNDRPVPSQLAGQQRQANADFEAANRALAQADANVRRAKAIPVIDCRTPKQEPPPADRRLGVILDEHNKARDAVGVPRLAWDPALAAGAQAYAAELARTGQRVHATREGRGNVRENLNQGMLGWGPGQMLQNWLRERQNFIPGTYPDVSKTGRWQDVSHYTQMIWPKTTHVGCGLSTGSGYQWLVCRYAPGGNRDGTPLRLDLGKITIGGGMTQIDPPAPPPPPRPTARDEAPDGIESSHPVARLSYAAFDRHAAALKKCDQRAAREALDDLHYAIDQLRARLKAANEAGGYSAVNPDAVAQTLREAESLLEHALKAQRAATCPPPRRP